MYKPDRTQIKGALLITNAICKATKLAGGQVAVQLENFSENDIGLNLTVKVVGSYPLKDDRGLVLFSDSNRIENGTGYWLGKITDRFSTAVAQKDFEAKLPEGTKGLIDESGNNQILVTASEVRLKSKTSELILNNKEFKITNNSFSMSVDGDGFSAYATSNKQVKAGIKISKSGIDLTTAGNFNFKSFGDINLKANGNVIIDGNTSGKAIDLFHVKSSRVVIESSQGPITMMGSAFNVKVSSSLMSPGSSSNTSASIEVVQGNMNFSSGLGNVVVRALSPAHTVKIVNGFSPVGLQSFLEVGGMSAKMGAELVPGVGAYFTAKKSGQIEVKALLDIKIQALIKTLIDSALVEFKTMMLDLKGAKMIDASGKVAIPGPGPFCSLPNCPILGIPLTGGIAVG